MGRFEKKMLLSFSVFEGICCSVAGSEGYSGGSGYAASKFAVRGLTESLRKELVNTPIRVTHIAPGLLK